MNVFGGRVTPTRLFYPLVILMSIATSQAGESIARCRNETDGWSKLGQPESSKDVCIIAQELMNGTCGLTHITPLDHTADPNHRWYTASLFYDDESLQDGKECACERVMYNLLSACAGCQKWDWSTTANHPWQSFETYQSEVCKNLTANSTSKRAVTQWSPTPPSWATNLVEDFDPERAAAAQASAGPTPDTTNASPSTVNTAVAETPSPVGDVPQSANSSGSGPPVGAIVGGVIGGLIFLGAIAGLAYWIYCRKRRARDVAPSSEFLKPEYYATPPLLTAHERRESAYRDEIEEETRPNPAHRQSWASGLMTTRRHEEEDDDSEMLPPFTRGAYIGPSPHEKGQPERRDTGDTDITMRTNNTTTFLLSSSPNRRPGPSDYFA